MSDQRTPKLDIRSVRRIRLAVYTAKVETPADWTHFIVRECDFCSAQIQDRREVGPDALPVACPGCQNKHRKLLFPA